MEKVDKELFRKANPDKFVSLEEGHYYAMVSAFCDIVRDSIGNAKKEEMLRNTMQDILDKETLRDFTVMLDTGAFIDYVD